MIDPIAAPAAPEIPALSAGDALAALSPTQRAEWQKSGKLPNESTDVPAEGAIDAKEPSSPESEAGRVLAEKKNRLDSRKGKIQEEINEIVRTREESRRALDAERRELDAIRAERRAYETQRTGQPAQTSTALAADNDLPPGFLYDPNDPRPDLSQFSDYSKYNAQESAWVYRGLDRGKQWQAVHQTQQQQAARAQQEFIERCNTFAADHDDFQEVMRQATYPTHPNGAPATPTAAALVEHVRYSDAGPQLIYHLGSHPEDMQKILAMPPGFAVAALGRLEARLTPEGFAAPTGAPAPKLTSSAPEPPPTVGTRPTAPADDLESAIKSGDFRRFREASNRRSLAAVR